MAALITAARDFSHLPILLVIGFAILAGTIGARIFQRLRIPQVVGYIAIGLLAGQSGLRLIDAQTIKALAPFSFFALGVIGFNVGGELHREVFRKYGRQLSWILLGEGLGAFVMVSVLVTVTAALLTGSLMVSVALGVVFGAISSATAPAATVNVLWEYKTRGVLTTTVFAILALDDALALVLFSIAAAIAGKLVNPGDGVGLTAMLGHTAYELIGAGVIGAATGLVLNLLLRRLRDPANTLALVIGVLALLIGGATLLGMEIILAAMALGAVLTNLAGGRSKRAFEAVEGFAPPIYVLFFVLAGAHINASQMPGWMWAISGAYLVGRTAGKIVGAGLSSRLARAAPVLQKYLGMALFCQGGVAVGLALMASARFAGVKVDGIEIGSAIMLVIAVTTFVVEIIGPPFVKLAAKKAGEIGLNVTEEDLIASYRAADVMDRNSPSFTEGTRLVEILATIADSAANAFPVTNADGQLTGVITIHEFKQSFRFQEMGNWLVAADLMQPVPDTVAEDTSLADAIALMRSQQLEFLPVVRADDKTKLAGMLVLRTVNRALSAEILRRRELAASNGG